MKLLDQWFDPSPHPTDQPSAYNTAKGPALVGGILPHVGIGLLSAGLLYRLNKQIEANQIKRRALKQLIRKSTLDIELGHLPPDLSGEHGVYIDPNQVRTMQKLNEQFGGKSTLKGEAEHGAILTPKSKTFSPVVMAHELGHGQDYAGQTGLLEKLLLRIRMPAALLGFGGSWGMGLHAITGQKTPEQRERILNIASAISGLGALPTLASEYTASRNAMKLLEQMPTGVRDKMLESGRSVLPGAWGTYGLAALGGVLGPQAAKFGLRWGREHQNQETQ